MKTKIIIAAIAVIVIVLAVFGIRYREKFLPTVGESNFDTQSVPETAAAESATTAEVTTIKPFVEAKTEIITTATPVQPPQETTRTEPAQLVGERPVWPENEIFAAIPAPQKKLISNVQEFKSEKGRRFVIRLNKFSYSDFLDYINKLEKAGFPDKNSRANAPETAPDSVAMYYSAFDGTRSFGVYWHGEQSRAEFDCEIVVCDYDQTK